MEGSVSFSHLLNVLAIIVLLSLATYGPLLRDTMLNIRVTGDISSMLDIEEAVEMCEFMPPANSFEVEVCRTTYWRNMFTVTASCSEEAEKIAHEAASNYEFSEHVSDYETVSVRVAEDKTTLTNNS